MIKENAIPENTIKRSVAAVSAGIVKGTTMLDLCYEEDSIADVDVNVVMTDEGEFIEVQGTAEGEPFTSANLNELLDLAQHGIQQLFTIQNEIFEKLELD